QRGSARARFLPGQPRKLSAGGFSEVRLGGFGCFLLALFDIVNRLRWRNPTLRVDVVHGCLYALSVVFREQPQMLTAYFNFGPYASINIGGFRYAGNLAWSLLLAC